MLCQHGGCAHAGQDLFRLLAVGCPQFIQMAGGYQLGNELSLRAPDLQRENTEREGCM